MNERTYYLGRVKTILARINEIYDDARGVADCNTPDYAEAWEGAYDLIFSDDVSMALASIFNALSWRFDYCDPDTTYEDDVRAYVMALREFCATKQGELDAVSEVPDESDLADLNWIDGPPTCEGEWLIQYETPRTMSAFNHVVLVRVSTDLAIDDRGGLLLTFPPEPHATVAPSPVPMFVAFPGNNLSVPFARVQPPKITSSCLLK